MEITFERSAAQFMLDTFPKVERKCGACGTDITADNLGGIIGVQGTSHFICDSVFCLLAFGEKHKDE